MASSRRAACSWAAALLVALGARSAGGGDDPLALAGLAVSGGAAPGYVADEACGACHAGLAASYREVGMGRSFGSPDPREVLEVWRAARVDHPPSHQRFELVWRGGRLLFRREPLGRDAAVLPAFEQPVDWVLGSGHRARTYLYRTPGGELYQLPIAWYAQEGRFGMAPGYDRPDHEGVLRRVRRECLFCHNAYPDVPAGSDGGLAPHVFPEELPHGIGCQRCHGPGAAHARAALSGVGGDELRATIVNPARLPAARRDEVCFQCHLQPAVALPGPRRLDRGDYSFRPGEPLAAYQAHLDVREAGVSELERFEINHHAYRLRQSACFQRSAGRLSCLSCHDPHVRPGRAERRERARRACLGCHSGRACRRPDAGRPLGDEQADCVACHMPERRPRDVVHVTMTDHRIQRGPVGPESLAPRAEGDPELVEAWLLEPEAVPEAERELYRALAVVRQSGAAAAIERLRGKLFQVRPAAPEPWLELSQGMLARRRLDEAEAALALARERATQRAADVDETGALLLAARGRAEEARLVLQASIAKGAYGPDSHYNLGRLELAAGRAGQAATALRRALDLRPVFPAAWLQLGHAQRRQGQAAEALASYRRALQVDPGFEPAYLALAELLEERGQRDGARRLLRHGATLATSSEALRAALQRLERR